MPAADPGRCRPPAARPPAARLPAARLLAAGLLAAAALAGCVPHGGPVRRVGTHATPGPLAGQGVRVLAAGPSRGASRELLVREFLLASADPDDEFAVARSFLAPQLRKRWRPDASVTLYSGASGGLSVEPRGRTVVVSGQKIAGITGGDYRLTGTVTGSQVRRTFRLTRIAGQWRIARLAPGIFLSGDLFFAYKPVNLYYFAPGNDRLVPDRVFLLTNRSGLPDTAVRALLAGPSPLLRGAVDSAAAGVVTLSRPATVAGGVLDVWLDSHGRSVRTGRLVGQLLWTAAQLPEVTGVRVHLDGRLYSSGERTVLRADPDALRWSPDGLASTAPAYYLTGTGSHTDLISTAGRQWSFTAGGVGLRHPALSADGSLVAGLGCQSGCRSLLLGRAGSRLRLVDRLDVAAGSLSTATWDPVSSTAWTVQSVPGSPPRAWAVSLSGHRTPVQLSGVRGSVPVLRLSRDGTRAALVVAHDGSRVAMVGVVLRHGGTIRVGRLRPVAPGLQQVEDISWQDSGYLVLLARPDQVDGSAPTPYRVLVDGSGTASPVLGTTPDGRPATVAAAPGHALLVGTAGRQDSVSALEHQTWRVLGRGRDPTYPG